MWAELTPLVADMKDRFTFYHPLVNFLYFTLVIGFSMALIHPLAQLISLVCAVVYAVQTEGRKAVGYTLKLDSSKFKVQSLRLYATASNLLTITPYNGYDPEVSSGTDSGAYPASRTFTFGVNVTL